MRSVTLFGTNLCLTRESENPRNRWLPKTVSNDFGKLPRHQGLTWKRIKTKVSSKKNWVAKKMWDCIVVACFFQRIFDGQKSSTNELFLSWVPRWRTNVPQFFLERNIASEGENQKETPTSTPSTTHAWDAVEDPRHHLFGISLDQVMGD